MMIDLALTEDGDLYLGAPKYNDDGTLALNSEGKPIQDLTYVHSEDTLKQIIYCRLKTQAPDWFFYPELGANLEDLIGELNTRENGAIGEGLIRSALMYDNFLTSEQIEVRAMPVNKDEMMIFLTVTTDDDTIKLQIPFSYTEGLKGVL